MLRLALRTGSANAGNVDQPLALIIDRHTDGPVPPYHGCRPPHSWQHPASDVPARIARSGPACGNHGRTLLRHAVESQGTTVRLHPRTDSLKSKFGLYPNRIASATVCAVLHRDRQSSRAFGRLHHTSHCLGSPTGASSRLEGPGWRPPSQVPALRPRHEVHHRARRRVPE